MRADVGGLVIVAWHVDSGFLGLVLGEGLRFSFGFCDGALRFQKTEELDDGIVCV